MNYTGRSSRLQQQKQPNNNFSSSSSSSSSEGKLFRGVRQKRPSGKWVAEICKPRKFRRVRPKTPSGKWAAEIRLLGEHAHLNFSDLKQLKANALKGRTAALLEAKLQAISSSQANKKGSMESSSSQSPPSNEHSVQKYSNLMANSNFGENSTRKEREFGLESNVGSDNEVIIESKKRHQDLVSDVDAAAVELSRMSSLDMDMMIWDALQLPHS